MKNKKLSTIQPPIELVESVDGSSLTLEGVYDIQCRHRLPLRVFGVGHSVFDHILQKRLDHRSGFLVNLSRDPLHSASPRQSSDGRLGDSRDVSFASLSEPFSSALSQTFASFSSSRHCGCEWLVANDQVQLAGDQLSA